ncbi:MAG TPA: hypothetical protein VLT87_10255 [Thermoanaerobaculia bacterium]|nr:hypothetical protein [Thermoanaerobaculia bacterium]
MTEHCIISSMHLTVRETVEQIAGLRSPVARTSHIGNNTANNWAWLALGRNTYMLQWEHSLYGIDDIFIPWVVLGDAGIVEACYDALGEPHPEAVGEHVTRVFRQADRKFQRHLSHGIFARHAGEDLITGHCRMATRIGQRMNDRPVIFQTVELLQIRDLLSRLVRDLCRERSLHLLINRWVRRSRKGHWVILKLKEIQYPAPGEVALITRDSMEMFRGTEEDLLDLFFQGLEGVARRLLENEPPELEHYPWIHGYAVYLLCAVKEHAEDPSQESFWHGGGSSSQYYIHEEEVAGYVDHFRDVLARLGYLPPGLQIRLIPTFSAQLFATRPESLSALESLLELWREVLGSQGAEARRALARLASEPDPRLIAQGFSRSLSSPVTADLLRRVDTFNALDPHQLPIANVANCDHPTYNKYGMAQRRLLETGPLLFPEGFLARPWGESELLVKVLAELLIDRQG